MFNRKKIVDKFVNILDEAVKANRQTLINLEDAATAPDFGPNGVVYVARNGGEKARKRAEKLAEELDSVVIARP